MKIEELVGKVVESLEFTKFDPSRGQLAIHKGTGLYFVWVGTHWEEQDPKALDNFIYDALEANSVNLFAVSSYAFKEIKYQVEVWLERGGCLEMQPPVPYLVAFEDCALYYKDGAISTVENDPAHWNTTKLPIAVSDAVKQTNKVSEWLETVFHAEDKKNFDVMVGLTILRDRKFQKFAYIYGAQGTGKSTLAKIFQTILPAKEIATADDLFSKGSEGDRVRYAAHTKTVAFVNDPARASSFDVTKLNNATEHANMSFRGLYREAFEAQWLPKIFIMSNHLPAFPGFENGVDRRILPLKVINSGVKGKVNFFESSFDMQDVCWYVYSCILAAIEVLKAGEWTLSVSEESALENEEAKRHGDHVYDFMRSVVDTYTEDKPFGYVFIDYTTWCAENNIQHPKNKRHLSTALKSHGQTIKTIGNKNIVTLIIEKGN